MKKIRIAQIGILHDHASAAFDSMRRQSDIFDLVGYATETDAQTPLSDCYKGKPRLSVAEILAMGRRGELDAVAIETNELALTRYATAAAEVGLSVHMDKPGGASLPDFERLIGICREKGLVFHTGYMYRYNPCVLEALRMVREGRLGEIHSLEAQMNCMHNPKKRQWLSDLPGGMMFFLGCHLIDLAVLFMGVPDEVIPFNGRADTEGVTAQDIGFAVLRYPRGNVFVKSSAAEPCGFLRRQLVIAGSKGTVELNPIEKYVTPDPATPHLNQSTSMRYSVADEIDVMNWGKIGTFRDCPPYNRYDAMMRAFAEMVVGERVNPRDYDDELSVYKTVLRSCGVL